MEKEIADKNLFMICRNLNFEATSELPAEYHIRNCKREELDIWMEFPFDSPKEAKKNKQFMKNYFEEVYGGKRDKFFKKCKFVCNRQDSPVATGFTWKAYDKITTIHWLKVLKKYEGMGIGRALLSRIMLNLSEEDYPVFLHTHPGSYRAIKLYSDFGFYLSEDPVIGSRENHLKEALPYLREKMPDEVYENLKTTTAPDDFLNIVGSAPTIEF